MRNGNPPLTCCEAQETPGLFNMQGLELCAGTRKVCKAYSNRFLDPAQEFLIRVPGVGPKNLDPQQSPSKLMLMLLV